jgi:O-antigen chain-terminating methyltransferase
MIETNIKDLSIEEIIQKIKQEVTKRKHSLIQECETSEVVISQKNEQIITDIHYENINIVDAGIENFTQKEVYIYADFTKYHDVEFIRNCYRVLLKREADVEGMNNYLTKLRNGQLSKSEIISILRYSKEGKTKNVKLLGSKKRYMLTIMNSIPVLGYFFKLVTTLFTLPRLIKRLNEYENYTYQLFMKNLDNDIKLQNAVNQKADKTELETLNNDLESSIDIKVDGLVHENTLLQVQKDIDSKLAKKVNSSELELPNIPTSLEVKAIDFLADAISKFSHPIDSFKDFNKDELYYSLFESTFYNHKVVLEKQAVYLDYIPSTNTNENLHLDIGCGRGEFLILLKKNNYHAMGVDINSLEVQTLKKQNFDVVHNDMISFLNTTTLKFSSISALQVIEHIDYDMLKEFVILAYEKISKDGVLILETINPHNKVAFNSFYMDETHKRPLPPEMVAFILQYSGFKNIKFRYTSPMPKEFRSKENNHINYHDYAVIGYKI